MYILSSDPFRRYTQQAFGPTTREMARSSAMVKSQFPASSCRRYQVVCGISLERKKKTKRLTEFDEALAELVFGEEAAILRIGRPLERRERDEEMVLSRVDDHVALLAAVAPNQRRAGIRSIVDIDGVQRAANQWQSNRYGQ